MRLDDRWLDELKGRVRLSELVGRTVVLKRAGREWRGLSPFAKEKTPSFYVNDDKLFWHCFSTGKHGDAIDWLVETERLDFRAAAEQLAGTVGMQVPQDAPADREREEKRRGLQDWMEAAATWMERQLRAPAGEPVRAYLRRRGLDETAWSRFRLGYAPPDRRGLHNALVQQGARPGDLVEAGLLIAPEGGGDLYDRFRDRLIFPITDGRGRVVSLGGRAMGEGERAKYLNGPASPIFDKGSMVYGMAEARRLLRPGEPLFLVEGYMDTVACHLSDVPAVAPMGTSLTPEQLELLWKVTSEPVLCFDGDAAGLRAAGKAVERALPHIGPARSLRFIMLGGGRDPDDVWRERGPAALRGLMSRSLPMVQVLFERARDEADISTPEGRAALKRRLVASAEQVEDQDTAKEYRFDLLRRFGGLSRAAWEAGRQRPGQRPPLSRASEGAQRVAEGLASEVDPVRAALVAWAIDHPGAAIEAIGSTQVDLGDERLEAVVEIVIDCTIDGEEIAPVIQGRGLGSFVDLMRLAAARAGAPFLAHDDGWLSWSQTWSAVGELARLSRPVEGEVDEAGYAAMLQARRRRQELEQAIRTGRVWGVGPGEGAAA